MSYVFRYKVFAGSFLLAALFFLLFSLGSSVFAAECGDGVCEEGETYLSCDADCPVPECGDGICNGDETCNTCDEDCECDPQGLPDLTVSFSCDSMEYTVSNTGDAPAEDFVVNQFENMESGGFMRTTLDNVARLDPGQSTGGGASGYKVCVDESDASDQNNKVEESNESNNCVDIDCDADTEACWTLSGRVYEGDKGVEPPDSSAIPGASVSLYGANNPYPAQGTFLKSDTTDTEGWYGIEVCGGNWEFYNIIETDPSGYQSVGGTSVSGLEKTANWIQYEYPLEGKTLTGNKFWDEEEGSGQVWCCYYYSQLDSYGVDLVSEHMCEGTDTVNATVYATEQEARDNCQADEELEEEMWCCYPDGSVDMTTESTCNENKGTFYDNEQDALAACSITCAMVDCGDGNCDKSCDEDCNNCPADCGECEGPCDDVDCGDGKCEKDCDETCHNCPGDCGECESGGDDDPGDEPSDDPGDEKEPGKDDNDPEPGARKDQGGDGEPDTGTTTEDADEDMAGDRDEKDDDRSPKEEGKKGEDGGSGIIPKSYGGGICCVYSFIPSAPSWVCDWLWVILFVFALLALWFWRAKTRKEEEEDEKKDNKDDDRRVFAFYVLLLAMFLLPILVGHMINPCWGIITALIEIILRLTILRRIKGWDKKVSEDTK
jgi:hypothetical protein